MSLTFEPMPDVSNAFGDRMWGARHGQWSFLVTEIKGGGWSASYGNHDPATFPPGGRPLTTRIGDQFSFRNFKDAAAACNRTLAELRRMA